MSNVIQFPRKRRICDDAFEELRRLTNDCYRLGLEPLPDLDEFIRNGRPGLDEPSDNVVAFRDAG